MRSKAVLAGLLVLLTGCALIREGTSQTIIIDSKPRGADFQINDDPKLYRTPYSITLPKEEHVIKFKKKGFQEGPHLLTTRTSGYFYWSLLMGVLAGGVDWISGAWRQFETDENGYVVFELEPSEENQQQVVYFSSNPPGASIKLNDLDLQEKTGVLGSSPTKITIKWGDEKDVERTVLLKYPGYADAMLRLRRGEKKLHKELDPNPDLSKVFFDSEPKGATVLIDGIPHGGVTPVYKDFEWYRHTQARKVEFRKEGYHSEYYTIAGKADICPRIKLRPQVNTVPLRIDCTPAGALLEVDGKPAGSVSAEVNLDWSVVQQSHTLRISRPGYESWERTIEAAKASAPITIRLKPSLPRLP